MDSNKGDCPKEGEQLSGEQRERLKTLVKQFSDVFKNEPGCIDLVKHKISTGDANPVLKQELDDMMKRRIIEPSVSEWSSPIVLVGKKDGTMRLCVDYRRLNELTTSDVYPMQRVDDVIDRVGGANYFSTLDLTKGYWQVPVEEKDRPKTSFSTPSGLYQFTMMPFGLKGAPATFQWLMDQVITGLDGFVSAYLDDVIIFSDTFEDHLNHLQQVLIRLEKAGLTAKLQTWIVEPQQDKVKSVKEFPIPKSKKDVWAFLGLVGYYRKFTPNFSTVAVALTDLTRTTAPTVVQWNSQCQKAVDTLKDSLCESPLLHSPDFSKQFILQTDASERAVGAVLKRYSTIEKECLAIKLGIQAFKLYLLGRPFQVQTDHQALMWLNRVKDKTSRLTRWSVALQPFDFTIVNQVGKANANADALSRIPSRST
uniref:Reverse transcriptase domain-containing protein n=1 Tax=Amphimedon queenslandica TaxID=400682 RepID=A0A1X7UT63_AMPQE